MAVAEQTTIYAAPGSPESPVSLKARYENFIGGHWVAPVEGAYSPNPSPATGQPFCEVARSTPADVDLALDAAHAAREAWGETSTTDRAKVLNAIADAIEANLEMLAVAESWENGKPVRETLGADLPLAIDHFRYFAGAIRSEEGRIGAVVALDRGDPMATDEVLIARLQRDRALGRSWCGIDSRVLGNSHCAASLRSSWVGNQPSTWPQRRHPRCDRCRRGELRCRHGRGKPAMG